MEKSTVSVVFPLYMHKTSASLHFFVPLKILPVYTSPVVNIFYIGFGHKNSYPHNHLNGTAGHIPFLFFQKRAGKSPIPPMSPDSIIKRTEHGLKNFAYISHNISVSSSSLPLRTAFQKHSSMTAFLYSPEKIYFQFDE